MSLSGSAPDPGSALEQAAVTALGNGTTPVARRRRGLRSLVAFDHCRVEAPAFCFAGKTDPVSQLHRLALVCESGAAQPPGALRGAMAYIAHLAVSLRQGAGYFRKHAAQVARRHGVSRSRQVRDLAWCAWRNNQFVRHYYWRGLFLTKDRATWLAQLEHRQLTRLLSALNHRLPVQRVANKFLFAEHARLHGLPVIPTLAAWNAAGEALMPAAPLPPVDLFIKPLNEYGGVGTVRVPFDPRTGRYDLAGEGLTSETLRARLAVRAAGQGCLLQAHQINCAASAALFGQSELASLRIVTGLSPGGEPRVLGAGLRVPSRFTTLGHDRKVLMARVDIADGRLGPARFRNACLEVFPHHPDTGAPLEGEHVPGWPALVATALAAHRTYPWMPFIGWDLAMTEAGPLIIEANVFWSANLVQLPGATPLAWTGFAELYLEWYQRLGLPALALV